MGTVKPEGVPPLNAYLHIDAKIGVCRDNGRIAGGCTNHVASYFEFGTHFRSSRGLIQNSTLAFGLLTKLGLAA
jgi:hypothetical protein